MDRVEAASGKHSQRERELGGQRPCVLERVTECAGSLDRQRVPVDGDAVDLLETALRAIRRYGDASRGLGEGRSARLPPPLVLVPLALAGDAAHLAVHNRDAADHDRQQQSPGKVLDQRWQHGGARSACPNRRSGGEAP